MQETSATLGRDNVTARSRGPPQNGASAQHVSPSCCPRPSIITSVPGANSFAANESHMSPEPAGALPGTMWRALGTSGTSGIGGVAVAGGSSAGVAGPGMHQPMFFLGQHVALRTESQNRSSSWIGNGEAT